jgi:hypothetical protein
MTIRGKQIFMTLFLGLAACGNLAAGVVPAGDSLFIQLDPLDGAVHGPPGATVGWGFTVNWTSTGGHWISFTGSSLGSVAPGGGESNPSVLSVYTDYIGAQGGPVDFGIGPSYGLWTEPFVGSSQGIGAYRITSDISQVGANDFGQITINYDVTDRDPLLPGSVDLGAGSYYGASTAFSVTVDATSESVPEPTSFGLLLFGAATLSVAAWRGRRRPEGLRASGGLS